MSVSSPGPVRLQKLLAQAGVASRRQAEEWIREGRVSINGRIAVLGERADPSRDAVKVDGRRLRAAPAGKTYLLLNKPRGYVTTTDDPERRDTVMDLVPGPLRGRAATVKPVGRLDVQTEGLILLTDDGDLARDVTHPSNGCVKEYEVKVSGVPAESAVEKLRRGIFLDGRRTLPCEIDRTRTTAARGEGNAWFRVRLREGRTRQIRRMFEALGHPVSKLKRVAIGPIRDPALPVGAARRLDRAEVEALRRSLERPIAGEAGRRQPSRPGALPAAADRLPAMTPVTLVAIDGPSGAGKSTAARALAERLRIPYIDTGAMYRAVGLAARERGILLPLGGPAAADGVSSIADSLRIELLPGPAGARVQMDGRDVTDAIREPEISLYASAVSAIPAVRRRLVAEQQRMGRARGGVLEGRDIGTKVFPETPFKFFLTAAPAIRASRRARELALRGTPQPYESVLAEMVQRDRDDATRKDSPLTLNSGYLVIDTGSKTPDEVVTAMEERIRAA